VARIVDEPDATELERQIDEVATNVYCFKHGVLAPALRRLSPYNSLGEYYLTDTVAVLHDAGYASRPVVVPDPVEALEVNDRAQLAAAEAELRRVSTDGGCVAASRCGIRGGPTWTRPFALLRTSLCSPV